MTSIRLISIVALALAAFALGFNLGASVYHKPYFQCITLWGIDLEYRQKKESWAEIERDKCFIELRKMNAIKTPGRIYFNTTIVPNGGQRR